MERLVIALDDVLEGIEFVSAGLLSDRSAYLCTKTGQVFFAGESIEAELPDDFEKSEQHVALPHRRDLGLREPLAFSFVDKHLPDALPKVKEIFSRAGAYPRFKDLLEQRRMLERWHQFENEALKKAARDWCKKRGINVDG